MPDFDSNGPLVSNWESGLIGILPANEDLSADFGFVVEVTVVSSVVGVQKTTAASSKVIGVTYTKRPQGRKIGVCDRGIVVVIASAAIAAGALIQSAAGGKVATWAGTNAHEIIGIALQAASADGDRIRVKLKGNV